MNEIERILLVTDLDNTLVGDDHATQKLNQLLSQHRQHCLLVYATGRSYGSAQQLKLERELIEPNYWVTGVGSEIYSGKSLDLEWARHIGADWQREAIAKLIGDRFPELKQQSPKEQNPWKMSFHLLGAASTITKLIANLQSTNLKAQVVFSSNIDVDILPVNAHKGYAVQYLQQRLGITNARTLVCGDSGNDISMFQQPALGVIVNNAQLELIEWYAAHADEERHYFAKNAYAAGILEALQKFNLIDEL
ncbi:MULTISPECIES: sucrose-phosphate phosphatase [Pseudanabaena]|uniref:sucrose-phosphate phosphatase n=2 Tax=Pseudanabaena TaxID=1152 RepID=L8MTF6_9CYAN|nr:MULTISPECIES: sucrose-phosphate phosphatase [Pseudanabaena]ELS31242.1 sucrose phosphatase [Pseudanabaena biceps PCC 7429]MDG3496492.1 sucrose-phosphate phosphatase [Pseudanabaena catenata USMAC16]